MSFNYIVKAGETIGDIVLNATGSFNNWDVILTANGFVDWTPALVAGQSVLIPDTVANDQNTQRQLARYPAANLSVNDVYDQIDTIISQLTDTWILTTRIWNDSALWKDQKSWID
jgi:phage tail protein X